MSTIIGQEMGIRTNQKRAFADRLTAENIEAAARIGERTLYRWLAENVDFQATLKEAQNQALDSAVPQPENPPN